MSLRPESRVVAISRMTERDLPYLQEKMWSLGHMLNMRP